VFCPFPNTTQPQFNIPEPGKKPPPGKSSWKKKFFLGPPPPQPLKNLQKEILLTLYKYIDIKILSPSVQVPFLKGLYSAW